MRSRNLPLYCCPIGGFREGVARCAPVFDGFLHHRAKVSIHLSLVFAVGAASAMRMRIAEGLAHLLDQFSDRFPLRLREITQGSKHAGIELNF